MNLIPVVGLRVKYYLQSVANRILVERTAVVPLIACLWIFCSRTSGASLFAPTSVGLGGVAYSSVASGDVDNDGRQDLLLTGADTSFTGTSAILRNINDGTFANSNAGLPGLSSSSAAWGDFDGDGRLDVLLTGLAGVDSNNFPILVSQVWRNTGAGPFVKIGSGFPGVDAGAVVWIDFDNDSNLDIFLTGYSSSGPISQIWRNAGNGSFSNINVGLPGVVYSSVARADFDGDGHVDVLLTGTTNGFLNGAITQIWQNRGDGRFANVNAGLPGVSQGSVAAGDFDNDSKPDILLTGYSGAGPISQVWRNLGGFNFVNVNANLAGVSQSSVAWGDFDSDDKLDILLTGTDGSSVVSQVLRNVGNGSFSNINAGLTGVRSGSSIWFDFDNDGKLDILETGLDSNNVPVLNVYRNNLSASNTESLHIVGEKRPPSGRFQFYFRGRIGFGYTILASTNAASSNSWFTLAPAREVSPGLFRFTDNLNYTARFYRVRRP